MGRAVLRGSLWGRGRARLRVGLGSPRGKVCWGGWGGHSSLWVCLCACLEGVCVCVCVCVRVCERDQDCL